jgi:predicted TPR repeat methyltransferase
MILKFFSDQLKFYSDLLSNLPIKKLFTSIKSFNWDIYYKETKEKLKDLTRTNYNLALFHLNSGNTSDAIMRFKITSYIDKQKLYPDIEYYLGLCYYITFKYDDSKEHLTNYIEKGLSEKTEEAKFLLSAIENKIDETKTIPSSLGAIYYEQMAKQYGMSLEMHEKEALNSFIAQISSHKNIQKSSSIQKILELGCKTGGVGRALKENGITSIIEAIEPSNILIEEAKASKFQEEPVYSSLKCCDIHEYISNKTARKKFDIIISHDALNLTPSLLPLFKELETILSSTGFIALSLRITDKKNWTFNNLPCRFLFNKDYIANKIKEAGLKISSQSEILFQNGDKGIAVIITK